MKKGSGNVFVSTSPLTKVDTQASARVARDVACQTLDFNCSNYDFYYIIKSNSPIVGGPSAGAAMTIATMSEIKGITPYSDVLITGTITPYGDIGPVGGVYEKAIAASHFAKIFLVPEGENEITQKVGNATITTDLNNYMEKNYNLSVIEIKDVYDAFKYMTGYEIKRPEAKVISYNQEGMKKIAKDLIGIAKNKYPKIDYSKISPEVTSKISQAIKSGNDTYKKALNSFDNEKYYSAASFAVNAITNYEYAKNLYGLYTNEHFFDDKSNSIRQGLYTVKATINNAKIDSPQDIEAISISYDRLMEAYEYLDKANKDYYSGNKEQAMYELAYAEMRRVSSYDWLFLLSTFKGNLSLRFSQENLKDLAIQKLDYASTYVAYADVLVSSQGNIAAHEDLKDAMDSYNKGEYLYSIFESTRAYADASIAIEAPYILLNSNKTLDDFRKGTLEVISKVESEGITPIMALNYLEYGDTLRDKDPTMAFIYYAYARNFATLTKEILSNEKVSIENKGVIIEKHYETLYKINYKSEIIQELIVLASGVLAGISFAIWRFEKRRKP